MTKNKGLLNKAHITTYEELETFSTFDEIRQYILKRLHEECPDMQINVTDNMVEVTRHFGLVFTNILWRYIVRQPKTCVTFCSKKAMKRTLTKWKIMKNNAPNELFQF